MSKHILVATDLSPRSDRAVYRAAQLARDHGARLTLLHVLDDAAPDDILRALHTQTTEHLERFAATAAQGVDYACLACVGDPTETLLDMVQDQDPSLLVIGTHRPRSILDALRETTAQRIVRLTASPVLMVKDAYDHSYETILGATDFSPSATAALNLGHMLAPLADVTPVHALHMSYQGLAGNTEAANDALHSSALTEAQAADTKWRAENALPVTMSHTQYPQGGAWAMLKHEAESRNAHLITAGAHGQTGDHRALLGSLASDLLRDPPCDILIARA